MIQINQGLIENPEETVMRIPRDGAIVVTINYELPDARRESTTTMAFRVTSNTAAPFGNTSDQVYQAMSTQTNTVTDIIIRPEVLGQLLEDTIVSCMRNVQSSVVVYRKVNVQCYNKLEWADFERFSSPRTLIGPSAQIVRVNSNLQENEVYRFKCSSGYTGLVETTDFVQEEALSLRCYVRGMEAYGDKPSRFLVLGTCLRNSKEAFQSPYVSNMGLFLRNGTFLRNDPNTISFIPIFKVAGFFRPCVVSQIEGIKRLAGSKSRNVPKSSTPSSQAIDVTATPSRPVFTQPTIAPPRTSISVPLSSGLDLTPRTSSGAPPPPATGGGASSRPAAGPPPTTPSSGAGGGS